MLRSAIAGALTLSLLAAPADAARLVHQSLATKSVEKGVSVWRGKAAPAEIAAPHLKAAPASCVSKTVVVYADSYPARLRMTRGFSSGEGFSLLRRPLAQGFYADRMAAGL